MQLDYLLQVGTKGYVSVTNDEEYTNVKEYLCFCDYRWFSRDIKLVNSTLFIFVPYGNKSLTYGDYVSSDERIYIDITQEVYQLAGLPTTPYEFW